VAYHSRRSPSQTKRFLTCPGALAVCSTLPIEQQNVAGDAAKLGTCVHKLIEECLSKHTNPEDYRDRIIAIEGEDGDAVIFKANAKTPRDPSTWFVVVDSDVIDGAQVMVDYVRKRADDLGLKPGEIHTESRTNPLPERDDTDGTADVTLTAFPFLLELVDYKNGYNVVEHRDNEQILSYLLGKAEESNFEFEEYRITVVQPHAPHDEGKVRSVAVSVKELKAHQARLRKGIALCEEAEEHPKAPEPDWEKLNPAWAAKYLKASEDGCFFCDARPVCPAYKKFMQKKTRVLFDDELSTIPREAKPSKEVGNAKAAAAILEWKEYAESLIKAAELYVQRALENGKKVAGFKLVEGRSNRKLKPKYEDAMALAAAMHKAGLMKAAKRAELVAMLMTKPELMSGPAIEKMLPPAERKKFAAAFLEKPPGKLTVAREDDGRPEVERERGAAFADAAIPFAEDETEFG
jgi:hypothetical protein